MSKLVKSIDMDLKNIPVYLTKHNPLFRQLIQNIHLTIRTTAGSIGIVIDQTNNKNCIRKIALLIYKIMIIQTYQALWSTYLKSGMGNLIINGNQQQPLYHTQDISIWPNELKALLTEQQATDNQSYGDFVREQLHLLDSELNACRNQLNILANQFHGYTLQLQNVIKSFIDEHCREYRMQMEHRIQLLHYDYHIRLLKIEYLRLSPNVFQEQLMKEICRNKYKHASDEQGYLYWKLATDRTRVSFYDKIENSPLVKTATSSINRIPNIDERQEMFERLRTIFDTAKNDILNIELNYFDKQRKTSRIMYEETLKKLWSAYHQPRDDFEMISSIMLEIIQQRCEKIGERIECIYKFS